MSSEVIAHYREQDDFIVVEIMANKSWIQIGFNPTFKTNDLESFLKILMVYFDEKIIKFETIFRRFQISLTVHIKYVSSNNQRQEDTIPRCSFPKIINEFSDSYQVIKDMFNEILNRGNDSFGGDDINEIVLAILEIREFKPVVTSSGRRLRYNALKLGTIRKIDM